ncbi:MAG TPA: glycoside hydrolase family 97 catalytic domain-containing protein, partial [Puia sp.]
FSHEKTSFALKGNYTLYQYNQESVFTPTAIDTLHKTCDLPATLTDGRLFLSIGEADNDSFTKAELCRGEDRHELIIAYTRDSSLSGVYATPWRTISIARTAIGLHAFSDLGLRLSPAPGSDRTGTASTGMGRAGTALAGISPTLLRPGKLIRAQLTTQAGLDCIDFAVRHHFQYILYDAGWYGPEYRKTSDPLVPIPAIDLPRVIAYGKERGIGVILYVNYVGLREKLDEILPLYKQWGVAGLKFGFVDGLTQRGISWLADAIRKVNDYGFILDIHDNYKPTGLSRTYPALLTQEGIRGDENGPDAFHTTVLPYTRFLAGAADFTFCFPNAASSFSKNIKVSKAQQLALTVIYYSPLQSMFWYGRPADYTNEDEIEFFKYVPTVWDETRYLAGDIGKNIAVARRKGGTWYLGCAAGMEDWDTVLKMDFLQRGKSYHVTVYEDDGKGGIRRRMLTLRRGSRLPVRIRAKGGMAMIYK